MFLPYARVLRTPGAPALYAAGVLGALALSMVTPGVLLLVGHAPGTLARAGLASGALTVGNGIGLIVQGRLIDRYGLPRVLVPTGLGCAAAFTALALAAGTGTPTGVPTGVLVALAGLAGCLVPAVITGVRRLLPESVTPADRPTAYALLAVLSQVCSITGPVVVSATLVLHRPELPVLGTGAVATLAAAILVTAAPGRHWRPTPPSPAPSPHRRPAPRQPIPAPRERRGAARLIARRASTASREPRRDARERRGAGRLLARRVSTAPREHRRGARRASRQGVLGLGAGLVTLLVVEFGVGVAIGAVNAAIPAVALGSGQAALAGPLFTCLAVGDLAGGVGYGAFRWRSALRRRLVGALLVGGVVVVGLAVASRSGWVLAPLLVVFGAVFAVPGVAASTLLDTVTPAERLAGSYTALVAATLAGSASGTATAGLADQTTGPWSAFLLAAAVLLGTAVIAWRRRVTLAPPSPPVPPVPARRESRM